MMQFKTKFKHISINEKFTFNGYLYEKTTPNYAKFTDSHNLHFFDDEVTVFSVFEDSMTKEEIEWHKYNSILINAFPLSEIENYEKFISLCGDECVKHIDKNDNVWNITRQRLEFWSENRLVYAKYRKNSLTKGEPEMSCNKIEEEKKFWSVRTDDRDVYKVFNSKNEAIEHAKRLVNTHHLSYYIMEAVALVKQPVPDADVVELK